MTGRNEIAGEDAPTGSVSSRPRLGPHSSPPIGARLRGLGRPWHRHRDRLLAGAVGLLVFLTYLSTLAPTVLATDAGRFQTRAYVLGIGHPSGYPTYIMLGKLFTYLPIGDVAYRVNLSSAVYATGAVILLYLVARRLTGPLPAVVAALAFGVSRTFWSQAVIAEVYTLNVLLICATLLALLVWRERRADRYLLLTAFLAGLSLTNHLTSGLLIPAAGLFVLLVDHSRLRDLKLLAKAAILFLLGLTPYLYLPIRAAMDPPINVGDPSNLTNFMNLVTGSQFRDQMWSVGPGKLSGRVEAYGRLLVQQFHPSLLALSLIGLLTSWRRDLAAWTLLVLLYLGWLVYALEYDIRDVFVYYIPTYLVIAVWLAAGVRTVVHVMGRLPRPGARTAAVALFAAGLLLVVARDWWVHYPAVDMSDAYGARNLIEAVARAPLGATVYDTGNTQPLQYMIHVERRRLDLYVEQVRKENVHDRLQEALAEGRQVYFLHDDFRKLLCLRGYGLRPENRLWRATVTPEGCSGVTGHASNIV